MAVEMINDRWNPGKRCYRTETFCYGLVPAPSVDPDRNAKCRVGEE
jgi:hypothetical protein